MPIHVKCIVRVVVSSSNELENVLEVEMDIWKCVVLAEEFQMHNGKSIGDVRRQATTR